MAAASISDKGNAELPLFKGKKQEEETLNLVITGI